MTNEELFRDKWKWQALNPLEPIENWPNIHVVGASIPCYVSVDRRPEGSRICTGCPVKWGTEDQCADTFCTNFHSPLAEWYRVKYQEKDVTLAARLSAIAWQISELPWSEGGKK